MKKDEKTILVVDDNNDVITYYESIIERYIGCNILKANNGDIAVDLYKDNNVDLVIMDMLMPFNGLESSNLIKKHDKNAKIMLVSAMAGYYFSNMMDDTGLFIELLHKPISMDKLVKLIEKHL